MGPNWVSVDGTTPLAWVKAHAETDFLDNASALDNTSFYFIDYEPKEDPPRLTFYGRRQTIYHRNRRIAKVDRAFWDLPDRRDHRIQTIEKLPERNINVLP